jgi:DNA polymerase III delta subunit
MYFDDFQTRLKKEGPPRLILLFGDSEGVIAEGLLNTKESFQKTNPEGTVHYFDGASDSLGDVISAAQTSGLFSSAQLLVLKHAEKTLGGHSEAALSQLKDYFTNPNPDTRMVFLAPGMRKNVKAVGAVERMGWAVQCADMPEWKIAGWLKSQAQARGLSLPDDGIPLLVQKVGLDLSFLQGALDQLALYLHPQKNATVEDIRNLPVPGLESEIFPFVDAVAMRQTEKALQMLGQLEDGVDAGTVILLYGRIRELLIITSARAQGLGQSQAAEKLGLNPYRLKILWDQSSQFTVEELKGSLKDLIHLQAGVVTGRLGKGVPKVWLESWILKWGKRQRTTAGR